MKLQGDDRRELCQLSSGGDLASFHAWSGLDSPVALYGCCSRCPLPKNKWFDAQSCRCAVRRNFFFQSAASHRDPFKELGIEHAPAKCPHCAVELTEDLRVKENAAFAAMSEPQRKVFLRERAKSHAGALGEEIVFIMDHVERAPSALHIRTNCSTYNMTVTFMRLPYSSERRLKANSVLDELLVVGETRPTTLLFADPGQIRGAVQKQDTIHEPLPSSSPTGPRSGVPRKRRPSETTFFAGFEKLHLGVGRCPRSHTSVKAPR